MRTATEMEMLASECRRQDDDMQELNRLADSSCYSRVEVWQAYERLWSISAVERAIIIAAAGKSPLEEVVAGLRQMTANAR